MNVSWNFSLCLISFSEEYCSLVQLKPAFLFAWTESSECCVNVIEMAFKD